MVSDIECPHCHRANPVAPSAIGHYVTCASCGSKYWVYVPPSEATGVGQTIREPARPRAGDESQVAIRQESLLAVIHDELIALRKMIGIASTVIALACAALIMVLLLR